ncbi:MAG: ABC transporter permease, partial [Bacteroides sp.]|nr:ABC transporter permease [Bacteroides sp.]
MNWQDACYLQSQQIKGIDSVFAALYSTQDIEVTLFDSNQKEYPLLSKYKTASPNYFACAGHELLIGNRTLTALDEVIVSESFVRRTLGNLSPIGLILRVDAGLPNGTSIKDFKIVNVARVEQPLQTGEIFFHPEIAPWWAYGVSSFLNGTATLDEVNKQLKNIVWPEEKVASCWARMEFRDEAPAVRAALLIRAISALILLSGLINFLKFIIQMFYTRQRELGIRQCLGSSWRGMFSMLFAEVFCMMSAALFLSFCISEISIALINHIVPAEELTVSFTMKEVIPLHCQIYVGVLVLCMVIILFPVYKLRKSSVIRPIVRRGSKHVFRYTMIGVQLAISLFFVGGVWAINLLFNGLIGEEYRPLSYKEEEQILTIPITSQRMQTNWETILQEVETIPGYEEHTYFASAYEFTSLTYMGYFKDDKQVASVKMQRGDPKSFEFFHIPMSGEQAIAEGSKRVYVNETFMKYLQAEGNTGTVRLGRDDYQIAGVYQNLYRSRESEVENYYVGSVFLPSDSKGYCFLKFTPGTDMDAMRQRVTDICRKYVPYTLPLEVTPADEVSDGQVDTVMLMIKCGILLGFVSLILVVLSIYSAISIDTVGRQKEIAIRKINGATGRDIASLFAKPYVVVYLLSFAFVYP